MPSPMVIAKNVTGSPVTLSRLGVTILGGQSATLSDFFRFEELTAAADLATAINASSIVINDGTTDLTLAQSISFLTPPNTALTPGLASPWKSPCRVVATANITLSGLQTIDSVSVVAADRVLVTGQTTASQNGIYAAASGAWSRAVDADQSSEFTAGLTTIVTAGTVNANTEWRLTTAGAITLGTTALSFAQVVTGGGGSGNDSPHRGNCRVASTANLTLSAPQTIDGVSVVAGDRVLAKNQTTGSENGIYVVAAGAWTRATDFDSSAEATTGCSVFVEEGTANAGTYWELTTTGAITLGTTALSFTRTDIVRQTLFAEIAADTTTTSVTFVTLLSVSITIRNGGFLESALSLSISNTSANVQVFGRLVINGVATRTCGVRVTTASQPAVISLVHRQSAALGAGTYTVALQWAVSGGTGQCRPVAATNQAEHASLLVREVTG